MLHGLRYWRTLTCMPRSVAAQSGQRLPTASPPTSTECRSVGGSSRAVSTQVTLSVARFPLRVGLVHGVLAPAVLVATLPMAVRWLLDSGTRMTIATRD